MLSVDCCLLVVVCLLLVADCWPRVAGRVLFVYVCVLCGCVFVVRVRVFVCVAWDVCIVCMFG